MTDVINQMGLTSGGWVLLCSVPVVMFVLWVLFSVKGWF